MRTIIWKTLALGLAVCLLGAAGGREAAGFEAFERRGARAERGSAFVASPGTLGHGWALRGHGFHGGREPFVHGPVHPGFFRGHNAFPDVFRPVQRHRFGSRPRFFGTPPVQLRIHQPYVPAYVPVPVYGGPVEWIEPHRGADRARVHRGEGRGAVVHDPNRDRGPAGGASIERAAPRGVARAPVARALEENAVGEPSTWTDPRLGAWITVTPTRDLAGEEKCREFRHSVAEPSGELHAVGVACRTPDGTWELIL